MPKRIKPGKPAKTTNLPLVQPPNENQPLRFSFRHLDLYSDQDFCVDKCADGYLEKFLSRLRDLCGMSVKDFRTNKSEAIRSHRIRWEHTQRPAGFVRLNQQLRDEEAWQFEITVNAHGRVHGLLIDDIFYIVWIDPTHALYE